MLRKGFTGMRQYNMTILLQYLAGRPGILGANLQGLSSKCRQNVQAPLVAALETRQAQALLFEAFGARKSVKSAKCQRQTSSIFSKLMCLPLGNSILASECRTSAADVLHSYTEAML